MLQLGVIAVTVVVKLGEYIVPYLHVTVTLAAYRTSRFAAAVFLTAVIVDLRTRTTRTSAMLPEVILSAKAENTLCRNTHLFVPDIKCLVIALEHRRIEAIRIKSDNLG